MGWPEIKSWLKKNWWKVLTVLPLIFMLLQAIAHLVGPRYTVDPHRGLRDKQDELEKEREATEKEERAKLEAARAKAAADAAARDKTIVADLEAEGEAMRGDKDAIRDAMLREGPGSTSR